MLRATRANIQRGPSPRYTNRRWPDRDYSNSVTGNDTKLSGAAEFGGGDFYQYGGAHSCFTDKSDGGDVLTDCAGSDTNSKASANSHNATSTDIDGGEVLADSAGLRANSKASASSHNATSTDIQIRNAGLDSEAATSAPWRPSRSRTPKGLRASGYNRYRRAGEKASSGGRESDLDYACRYGEKRASEGRRRVQERETITACKRRVKSARMPDRAERRGQWALTQK